MLNFCDVPRVTVAQPDSSSTDGDDAANHSNTHVRLFPLRRTAAPRLPLRDGLHEVLNAANGNLGVLVQNYACAVAALTRAWKLLRSFCSLGGMIARQ